MKSVKCQRQAKRLFITFLQS